MLKQKVKEIDNIRVQQKNTKKLSMKCNNYNNETFPKTKEQKNIIMKILFDKLTFY